MTTSEAVRAAGAALAADAQQLDGAVAALGVRMSETGQSWRGLAADAAAEHAQALTTQASRVSDAVTAAADVLRACASQLADADGLRRRADQLARHHEDPDLLAAAQRLRADAEAAAEVTLHRAAAELRQLSAAGRTQRSQLRGFADGLWGVLSDTAKQAWNLNPQLIAVHPKAWWSTLTGEAAGALQVAEHPRRAAAAALGLDQLRDHAYGEWAGTMLGMAVTGFDTGGAGRAASVARRLEREALLVAEDGSWTVRRVSTLGGDVRPRRGLSLPAGFPSRIRDVMPSRIGHILVGDGKGGGHRPGTGKVGKTEFPARWTDDDIIRRVMQTAMKPSRIEPGRRGNRLCIARHDGVDVVAVVAPDGSVISGYPQPGGRGVVDNKR